MTAKKKRTSSESTPTAKKKKSAPASEPKSPPELDPARADGPSTSTDTGSFGDSPVEPGPQERRDPLVGGWQPYSGGLLHWWPRHCFPCAGAPDDYCRKPLPRMCWPPYPPYYTWGPPEGSSPSGGCRVGSGESR